MADLVAFYLNSNSSVIQFDTLEISHPSFSKTYYIVRNASQGLTAQLENGTYINFEYHPLSVSKSGASDDLDQTLKISFGDLGEILPMEIDNCRQAGTLKIKPIVIHRTYRSDDLTQPLDGPYTFELPSSSQKKAQATLQAQAPRLNNNTTGESYTIDRFPMLVSCL